ncbi:hypothetical protein C8F04DRAFT_1395617 [Mycena alexandri]|uniref:Uncharacterized protein n=1 Tax=Mycena alexandri TaxID=1745969 RepID=A0AAD6SXJ1_9AGAR|nr:hypothetical protein C8F04DRAFT_1395617 [Mycena alexandri]
MDRPPTPDSPLTNRDSLYDATTTIDELTQALENVSRVPSPEPPGGPGSAFDCCCGRGEECENVRAWLGMKARLESRLTLSAEVGQALLQRHEAYVRRHEAERRRQHRRQPNANDDSHSQSQSELELDGEESDGGATPVQDQLDELVKENKALEKRLTQALVNNEVTEVSNKTILHELAEAKTTISRLTTSHARSVGWDTRLSAAMKEKDDMQQERDAESQRARVAEGRFAALKERTSKLQSDVRRLQNALEEKREHRLESSESIIVDARARLEALHRATTTAGVGMSQQGTSEELTTVLETLVSDNETLKRDNAELQTLLADAREDCRALQEEVEDGRVNPGVGNGGGSISRAGTPVHLQLRGHFHTGSVPSTMLGPTTYNFKRSSSNERRTSRRYEPLTPETNRRPLSPADSATTSSENRYAHFGQRQPSPSLNASDDGHGQQQDDEESEEKRVATPHRPLFLLARSRGVQTDPYPYPAPAAASVTPTLGHYPPSQSPSSAASIYSDSLAPSSNNTSTGVGGAGTANAAPSLSVLVERTTALLQRMQAADALSLTNRLKRAQIRGADVNHLSRSTIAGILADVSKQLRTAGGEEEMRAGKREVRALLGVLREMFGVMGEVRVLLNEVVLDPSSAGRVSEAAMDPGKAAARAAREGEHGHEREKGGAAGWMAPLSKLFAGSPAPGASNAGSSSSKVDGVADRNATASPLAAPRPLAHTKFVPKLGPALAASATTVNVEFSGSGAGMGRAMTSTSTFDAAPASTPSHGNASAQQPALMGIFAGAPVRMRTPDPWVVIPHPKLPKRMPTSLLRPPGAGLGRHNPNRMSRNVEAVLDGVGTPQRRPGELDGDEVGGDGEGGEDYLAPLLQRTLRRRGLSDSSIHSTFVAQGQEDDDAAGGAPPQSPLTRTEAAWLENGSVLQALSRRVQSFRSGLAISTTGGEGGSGGASSPEVGTSPPAAASPLAVRASRRSSRASKYRDSQAYTQDATSPLRTGTSTSGFGFLANLVPSGEVAELAMASSLREQDSILGRGYRPPGAGEREFV